MADKFELSICSKFLDTPIHPPLGIVRSFHIYTFIHNMIVAYVTDYKTGQVARSSTMAARGVGHLRDDDK